ncbi:MAG: hypothetical protein K9H64_23815 [Bacteroidales bacterium]|nr:hypothetical protein [Bacteroidales bacterium]MCF8457788.1 hypothetical protein [Bacteroidales bacterium]
MKAIAKIIGLILTFSLSGLMLNGQTVDEIIKKHIEAHGGMKNWDAVQSMKITGNFTSFSETNPFTEIKSRPGNYYASYHLGQHKVVDGKIGDLIWKIDPWFDMSFPRKATEVEANVIIQKAEFCTPFLNYKERGFKVELKGKEVVDGIECFKLELTRDNGQQETWFLNTKTYLEYMSKSMWSDFAEPAPAESIYEDFRKVGEVLTPFHIERVFSIRYRVTEIEKVELNGKIDPGIFRLPLSDEMKKLNAFEGEWNVVFDVLNRRGSWQNVDSTTSVVKYVENKNMLQETISYTNYFSIEKLTSWTFNSETGNYRMVMFNDFYSNTDVYQGTFSGDSLIFENTQISYGQENEKKSARKYIYSNISPKGFLLEVADSNDGGENWRVSQKFTYSRRID